MEYITEPILLDPSFPFEFYNGVEFQKSGDSSYMHNHVCLEINYAVSSGVYFIGKNEYPIEKGDIFIINNYEYHAAFNDSKGVMLKVIVFDADLIWRNESTDYQYIKAFYEQKSDFNHRLSGDNELSPKIAELFEETEREWNCRSAGYKLVIKALLLKILALIYRGFEKSEFHSEHVSQFQNDYIRIVNAIEYIDNNFKEPIQLSKLAEIVYMNPNYFSTFFSKTMNCSVTEYVLELKMRHACLLLTTSGDKISEIAVKSGFDNISYFNRAFKKKFGITPQEYRSNALKISE